MPVGLFETASHVVTKAVGGRVVLSVGFVYSYLVSTLVTGPFPSKLIGCCRRAARCYGP